jgi:signal transduction histidine kinase
MSEENRPRPRCFLALPHAPEFGPVKEAVKEGAKLANFRIIALDEPIRPDRVRETLIGELARADCVLADLTGRDPNVFFEVGVAQAMGKGLFLLIQQQATREIPFDLREYHFLTYVPSRPGLAKLRRMIAEELQDYRKGPRRSRFYPGARLVTPFFVDWERLDRAEAENLCRELLAQMGYQRVDWNKESREIDIIAELPKRDPDGFEYRELWLVSVGRNAPFGMLIDMAGHDPEMLVHHLFRGGLFSERQMPHGREDIPITLLFIDLEGSSSGDELESLRTRMEVRSKRGPYPLNFRIRYWDRNYLTSLVQQFPQIGYKYFSDEGRSQSKYRKTPDELYKENIELSNRQAALISALEDEKNRRARAERDAVWKDISFSAAHKIGNPIFAIETDLDPLQRRMSEHRTQEAIAVISNIRAAIEKAKAIVDQFKSLTRAQEIHLAVTLLCPVLEDACRTARAQGVTCQINCDSDVVVWADPVRLGECFDELASNAMHWFDKEQKQMTITVVQPAPVPLPQSLDSSTQYVLIQFRDNGCGVTVENKAKIFDAFFTTHEHGTGLGLALVRRIVEGHGGVVMESGVPGEGADFEIYLPQAMRQSEFMSNKGGKAHSHKRSRKTSGRRKRPK